MLIDLLYYQSELSNSGAAETLKDLSPWAYVIVLFALAVAGVFYKLYATEKEDKTALEKEFRGFMSESLTKQIDVSKDVIELVSRNKDDVKDALQTFNSSDFKVEALIEEVKSQLSRIEEAINRMNSKQNL